MANNPLLFNAALTGAMGALNTSRALVSTNPAEYANARNSALAFATAVDNVIPTDATTNSQDAELLFSICQQMLSQKGRAGDAVSAAPAIATAYNLVRTSLLPVGGGGGGSGVPLSTSFFVDPGTPVILADQTGAATAPFATVTQAVAAIQAIGGEGSVVCAPGQYPAEPLITIDFPCTFFGLTSGAGAPVNMENLTIDCGPSGPVIGFIDVVVPTVTNSGGSIASLLGINADFGPVTAATINVQGSGTFDLVTLSSNGIFNGSFHRDITLAPGATGPLRFKNCTFDEPSTLTGDRGTQAFFDGASYQSFLAGGGIIVDIEAIVEEALTPMVGIVWVDPDATNTVKTGSENNPFTTVQTAVDALPNGGTIMMAPRTYPAETVNISAVPITLYGITGGFNGASVSADQVDIVTDNLLSVFNVTSLGNVQVGLNLEMFNSSIVNGCTVGLNAFATNATLSSGAVIPVSVAGQTILVNSTISSGVGVTATLGSLDALGSFLQGDITCSSDPVNIRQTTLAGCTSLAAGNLSIDMYSLGTVDLAANIFSSVFITVTDIADPDGDATVFYEKDDFTFKGVADAAALPTAGQVVATGEGNWWAQATGAAGSFKTTFTVDEDRPGIFGIRTSAASLNATARIQKSEVISNTGYMQAQKFEKWVSIVRIPTSIANIRVQIGLTSDAGNTAPTTSMYFVYDSSISPNWFAETRTGGVADSVDTLVPAVVDEFHKFKITRRAGIGLPCFFFIDNAPVPSPASAPGTSAINEAYFVQTLSGAAAKGIDIDFRSIKSQHLSR